MDNLTPAQRHKNMKHIRYQDTKPEVILRKALWHRGIRYRKNYSALPGEQVKSNKEYWGPKLKRNVERDKEVNDMLTDLGWIVLRFWESDIKKNLEGCIQEIFRYLP